MSLKLFTSGRKAEVPVKFWTFPGGERNCRIEEGQITNITFVTIVCNFESSTDIVDLIMLTNAVRQLLAPSSRLYLTIPYFPFARQDRVMVPGEPNALQAIASVINGLKFDEILTLDPHSDVLTALFPGNVLKVKPQWQLWEGLFTTNLVDKNMALVSPDAGAAKKIYKLASTYGLQVIEAQKVRDPKSGQITHTSVTLDPYQYDTLVVVDDICDGGRTFVELAKALRNEGYTGKLVLCVTHGIFSQGLEPLRCFDNIYCINVMNANVDLDEFNRNK